jgi:ribose/xylose/arabinose/galactoside ABC-type transport system permease subunit
MQIVKDRLSSFRKSPAFTGFVLFMLTVILNMAVQGPAAFFSVRNLNTLFSTNIPFLLLVMAQGILLISGTLDVSSGVQLALVNVVTIMSVQELGVPFALGCLLGILAAMVASLVCWLCVSVLRLPDLLASYALTFAILGVNVLIMSVPQGSIPREVFRTYDSTILGFFPVSVFALLLVAFLWLYLKRTPFGTNIYAVGANPQNAFAAGISPVKIQFQAFMAKGFIVGIAGICLTFMTASGNPIQGEALGLRSLAACIIGGLTFGGWGTMSCALFGGGFLILIQNSVYFVFNTLSRVIPGLTISTYWHNLLSDSIIFLGLLLTIVTAKGQREALRMSIKKKYTFKRREEHAK